MARQPSSGQRFPHCWGFEIILRHTTAGRTSLGEESTRRRDLYLDSTQQSQEEDIHDGSWIRARNPSKRAALERTERLRWSRVSVLAFGTKVCGFKPDRNHRIFQGEKFLSTPSFRREVKPFVLCRRFTACKRSLNVTWKSGIFRQNSSAISRPSSSSFHYRGLWWRNLAVKAGTTKDQRLYNKPSAAVHPGGISRRDRTTIQYNTPQYKRYYVYGCPQWQKHPVRSVGLPYF